MSRSLTIHLSDEAYKTLLDLARRTGQSVEEWIASRVDDAAPVPPNGVASGSASADLMRFAGCIEIDDPTWSDNERIDRELADEYGSAHEEND